MVGEMGSGTERARETNNTKIYGCCKDEKWKVGLGLSLKELAALARKLLINREREREGERDQKGTWRGGLGVMER